MTRLPVGSAPDADSLPAAPRRCHVSAADVRRRAMGRTVSPGAALRLPDRGPVAVGVAGSRLDGAPIEFAFEQASVLGTDLVAVHTWSDSPLPDLSRFRSRRGDEEAILARERRLLAERLTGYCKRYPDVSVMSYVKRDRPAEALLEHVGAAGHPSSRATIGCGVRLAAEFPVDRGGTHTGPRPVAVVRVLG